MQRKKTKGFKNGEKSSLRWIHWQRKNVRNVIMLNGGNI